MTCREFPDLLDGSEWNLVSRQTLMGHHVNGAFLIQPQSFLIDSYVCQVGLKNRHAPTSWYLGAWATMLLPMSPSSTTVFTSAVAADNQRLRLGVLNLLIFPRLIKPWVLELKFPYWHEEIYLEVWRYDGRDITMFQRFDELSPQ
jgi:hypothetical protein